MIYALAFLVPYSAILTLALPPLMRWAWKRGNCKGFVSGLHHATHLTVAAFKHARESALEEREGRDGRVN